MKWYVYILLCDNGSLYKGFTNNLEQRYKKHLSGCGAEHTKKYKPIKIVYYEIFETEQEAAKREKFLKSGLDRAWLKEKLKNEI